MSPAHQDALVIIVALFGIMFFIIGGVIFASQRKKREPLKQQPPTILTTPVPIESQSDAAVKEVVPEQQPKAVAEALANTQQNIIGRIKKLFGAGETAESALAEHIEEILYTSDIGPITVEKLMQAVRKNLAKSEQRNLESVRGALSEEVKGIFLGAKTTEPIPDSPYKALQALDLSQKPFVLMVVGVNGVGKTTSIGKISAMLAQAGKKVLVAAGDTFRAAAGNQLKSWTDRAQVEIFSPEGVKDPSAVAFDAVSKAKTQGYDVVIIDTAGRLHTQANLMEELKKMKRVMAKIDPVAPHETWIVLDANSGQNALNQAREFNSAVELTGVVLTKMDGTAKGGVVIGLADQLKIPIRAIGVGERIEDLRPFSPNEFVESIFRD